MMAQSDQLTKHFCYLPQNFLRKILAFIHSVVTNFIKEGGALTSKEVDAGCVDTKFAVKRAWGL